jgi:hypothetical protein
MKRAGLQRSKFFTPVLILIAALLSSVPIQSAHAANCDQTVNNSTGVVAYESGIYCYVAFKSTSITYTWTKPSGLAKIDVLIVGGGGGGGARHAGGGGAGGIISLTDTAINSTSLTITVGAGGAGGPAVDRNTGNNAGSEGSNGSFSRLTGGGLADQTALGGGGGAWAGTSGSGASSGGGGCCGQPLGSADSVQGKTGGAGYYQNGVMWAGGGGGGYGAAGNAATNAGAGSGGNGGAISWITQTVQSNLGVGHFINSNTYFAGGGGGSTTSGNAGGGGYGGGGAGVNNATAGSDGTANTGGGGGAGGMDQAGAVKGGNGGSGVVVIRYIWDVTAPTVSTFSITSAAGADNYYGLGDTISLTIGWSETVTVTGTPRVPIQGLTSKYFTYSSGSGTRTLLFTYVVANGDLDTDGFSITANSLELNSGTIRDGVGNDATLTHSAISAAISLRIDGVPPTLSSVSIPSSGNSITLGFSETISSTIAPYSQFNLMVGTVQNALSAGATADSRLSMSLTFGVISGSVVTLSYTDPTAGNDLNAIQDEAGNDLASFTNRAVSNLSTKTSNTTVALALDPSSPTAVFRAPTSVKATVTAAGKVSFFHNGKIIVACRNVATTASSPFYATCAWKPSVQQNVSLSATYKSTTDGFTDSTSPELRVYVTRRAGLR